MSALSYHKSGTASVYEPVAGGCCHSVFMDGLSCTVSNAEGGVRVQVQMFPAAMRDLYEALRAHYGEES
jgi:hypothetical protein